MFKLMTNNSLNSWRTYSSKPGNFARREDAQSLVELALVVPLLILLLVATTEFARLAWASVLTSSAARAGAQYAAQSGITASDTAGIQAAAAGDSTNLSGLTTTASHTCYCSTAQSTAIACTLTACPAPATLLEYVQVNTSSTITPFGHYPGLPSTFTVTGTSIMEVEGP